MDCDFCKYAEDCHGPEDCIYPDDKSNTGSRGQIPKDITVNEAKKQGLLSKCLKCSNYSHYCGEMACISANCLYNNKEEMRKEIHELNKDTGIHTLPDFLRKKFNTPQKDKATITK